MGIIKKHKYFIGGYEGNQLEPIIKGIIEDAKQMSSIDSLKEICEGVLFAIFSQCSCDTPDEYYKDCPIHGWE